MHFSAMRILMGMASELVKPLDHPASSGHWTGKGRLRASAPMCCVGFFTALSESQQSPQHRPEWSCKSVPRPTSMSMVMFGPSLGCTRHGHAQMSQEWGRGRHSGCSDEPRAPPMSTRFPQTLPIDNTSLCLLREISRRLGLDPRQKAFKFQWDSSFKTSETPGIPICPPMKPLMVSL